MRWLYFGLAAFATIFAVLVSLWAEPKEKPEMLRVCITAAVVNLVIFLVMSWAKKRGERWMKEREAKAKN